MSRAQPAWTGSGWADGPGWIQIFVNPICSGWVDLLKIQSNSAHGLKWAEIA